MVLEDVKILQDLLSRWEWELKYKEEELEGTKMEMYRAQDYGQKVDAELEVSRRKNPSKSSFKSAKGIISNKLMKLVDKH